MGHLSPVFTAVISYVPTTSAVGDATYSFFAGSAMNLENQRCGSLRFRSPKGE